MFTEHVQGDMSLFWGSHAIKKCPIRFEWGILFPKTYMVSDVDRTLKAPNSVPESMCQCGGQRRFGQFYTPLPGTDNRNRRLAALVVWLLPNLVLSAFGVCQGARKAPFPFMTIS